MVPIGGWSGKTRWQCLSAVAGVVLVASTAGAIPQAQSGGGARTSVVRARSCRDCTGQASRREREILLMRLDSLRWEIDHRRLNPQERQVAAKELAKTLEALEAAIVASSREGQTLMAIESEAAQATPRAVAVAVQTGRMRGYIGVTFDGLWSKPPGASTDNLIRFYEYPKIALVDASSPAEHAGILVGDTLLALNGDDVREQEIAFGKLLIPNKRVTMRVRRDGSSRDLVVTVSTAPDHFVRRITPRATVPAQMPTVESSGGQVGVYAQSGVRGAQPPATFYWFGDALAGARLETVTGGLARALDVPEGVLVIRTVPGSATHKSGLREGDIVTHVGRTKVRRVEDLQRALTNADEREETLVIVREKKERQITLRW